MAYIGNSPGVSSQRSVTTFTATAGQTSFTTSSGYVLGNIDVFQNGVKLVAGDDFTATNGTSVTLTVGASVGDSIELVAYLPRGLSDGYTKAEADARFLDVSGDGMTGNLTFSGTGQRIIGDFSNATVANRVAFQTSTTNGSSNVGFMPNGTSTEAGVDFYNNSDVANSSRFRLFSNATEATLRSISTGTGTNLPITMHTGGSERLRIDTSGNVGIGTNSPFYTAANRQTTSINGGAGGAMLSFGISGTGKGSLFQDGDNLKVSGYPGYLYFATGNTDAERMRITSGGQVCIGTSTPESSYRLTVSNSAGVHINAGTGYYGSPLYLAGTATSGIQFVTNPGPGGGGYNGLTVAGDPLILGMQNQSLLVGVHDGSAIRFGDTDMRFGTDSNERMRITSGGVLELAQGQIKFPATQAASADSNTLDDYEEGTWTPNVGGNATYSDQLGTYIKIGRLVIASFDFTIASIGTGSSSSVSGLPFTSASGTPQGITGPSSYWAGLSQAINWLSWRVDTNSTTLLNTITTSATSTSTANTGIMQNGSRLIGTIMYYSNN